VRPRVWGPQDKLPRVNGEDASAGARSTGLRGWPAAVVGGVLRLLPDPVRAWLLRHREVLKFLIVGGTCFLVTVLINYALKLTVLATKPVTALTIATLAATVLSYVLNREWAFRTRGGRERRHEATLFFAINGVAVLITDVPLWVSRYLFDLRVPDVSRLVQEVSDFASGIVVGTLLAMVFRLWAYRTWVFPKQDVRLVRSSAARRAESAVSSSQRGDSDSQQVA
jgi:putative flippase GtrA